MEVLRSNLKSEMGFLMPDPPGDQDCQPWLGWTMVVGRPTPGLTLFFGLFNDPKGVIDDLNPLIVIV